MTPCFGSMASAPVVLFDGVCNLCNGTVSFLIDHDPQGTLRFGSLQSDAGRQLLTANGFGPAADGPISTILLFEDGRLYDRSTAALRIARHLGLPYRVLSWLMVVPRPLRDAVYGFVARNRYRWFGKSETCRVPTPELRARFL
jgi:predicted DCC family thiol-disulfide oxidoreductase YuxK